MKKVLIISQYYPPDLTAAAFRIGELAKYLSKTNRFYVEVLTTYPHKTNANYEIKELEKVKVNRLKINSDGHLKQYYEFLRKAKAKIKELKNYDWIFITTPPIFIYSLKKYFSKNTRIFLDVRDLWPDTPVAAGKLKKNMIYRFFKIYEKKMYKNVDYISVVSKPMSNYLEGKIGGKNSKTIVAYNGVLEEDLNKFPQKIFSKREITNFNIVYAGNIGLLQGLEIVFESFNLLEKLPIHFTFIGEGVLKNTLYNKSIPYKEKISFISPMEREMLINYLINNAHLMFLNLKQDEILEKTIPSKVFDYLLVSKPVISGIKGEGKEILQQTGGCVNFDNQSKYSLYEAVKYSIENYDELSKNAYDNMKNVLKDYTREKSFEKISKILSS